MRVSYHVMPGGACKYSKIDGYATFARNTRSAGGRAGARGLRDIGHAANSAHARENGGANMDLAFYGCHAHHDTNAGARYTHRAS